MRYVENALSEITLSCICIFVQYSVCSLGLYILSRLKKGVGGWNKYRAASDSGIQLLDLLKLITDMLRCLAFKL